VSVRYLATRTHNQLRENIRINQPAYLAGQASSLLAALGTGAVHESRIHGGEPPALLMPADNNLRDSENVRLIHTWLGHLTPVQASDPRLWTYLTHSVYSDYTAARWPIDPDADVTRRVRERYFVEGESLASITRNSIARLWWFGHLTHDPLRASRYELADVLLTVQDMQQAFLERTIGRSRKILHAALRLWQRRLAQENPPAEQSKAIQRWARLIRLHGAVTLLDALPENQLENLLWVKLGMALNEDLPELETEEPI
jgi:Family of unknown function (DUF6339)